MNFLKSIEKVPNSILIISSIIVLCILPLFPRNVINLLDSLLIRHVVIGLIILLTFVDFRFAVMLTVIYFIAINTKSRENYEDSLKVKRKISFDISLSSTEDSGDIKESDIVKQQEEIEEEIQTEAPPPPEPETSEPTPTEDTFANFYYL